VARRFTLDDCAGAAADVLDRLKRFGRIDTLVNNAGVFISKPFTDHTASHSCLSAG
jgi:NAD(P)-dependent dehydrogenase (short-subunit alcohol dehydrogenase family)